MKTFGIIVVGDELVDGRKHDTNSSWISKKCINLGFICTKKITVSDSKKEIIDALSFLKDNEYIFITGGLGPTHDDLTRESVASFINEELEVDDAALEVLKEKLKIDGRLVSNSNLQQAMKPASGIVLENKFGTAPGMYVNKKNFPIIISLPGPPSELIPMFENFVLSKLTKFSDDSSLHTQEVRAWGIAESNAGDLLNEIIHKYELDNINILSSPKNGLAAYISKFGSNNEKEIVKKISLELEQKWSPWSFRSSNLFHEVAKILIEKKMTLSAAESCTGGLLSSRCTEVPGSSKWFSGGVISYSNYIKSNLLDVPLSILNDHGAVSGQTVIKMAITNKNITKSDLSISISGIAGPSSDCSNKPVGTVWIGFANKNESEAFHFLFPGDRQEIRNRAVNTAMQIIRFKLLSKPINLLWMIGQFNEH